jgi:hypothetical protein
MKIRIEDWDHLDDLNLDDLEFSERINKKKSDKSKENPPVRDKYKKGKRKDASSNDTEKSTE